MKTRIPPPPVIQPRVKRNGIAARMRCIYIPPPKHKELSNV